MPSNEDNGLVLKNMKNLKCMAIVTCWNFSKRMRINAFIGAEEIVIISVQSNKHSGERIAAKIIL